MPNLTAAQKDALNDWARTDPILAPAFRYIERGGQGLGDLIEAIESDVSPDPLAIEIDEAAGNITYVGEAVAGSATSAAVWRIKRLDESGDPELIIKFADGDINFDNVWDDRTTLSYS